MDGAKALAWQTKDGEAKDFFLMQYAGSNANKLNFVYADETFNGNIPYLMAVPQALVGKNITFGAKNVKIVDNATRFCSADNNHLSSQVFQTRRLWQKTTMHFLLTLSSSS